MKDTNDRTKATTWNHPRLGISYLAAKIEFGTQMHHITWTPHWAPIFSFSQTRLGAGSTGKKLLIHK